MNTLPIKADLSSLGLTPEQVAERRKGIGGSDATIIVNGTQQDINHLALVKLGLAEDNYVPGLAALLGHWTEPFNIAWFEKEKGREVHSMRESRTSMAFSFVRCTLDGMTKSQDGKDAVFQAKFVNPFQKIDHHIEKYTPQITHEMLASDVDRAILSVMMGNLNYYAIELALDDFYAAQLLDREKAFWEMVTSRMVDTSELPPVTQPDIKKLTRRVDMSAGNFGPEWLALSNLWHEEKPFIDRRDDTIEKIKAIVPDDAVEASGHGLVAKRTKRGLTIRSNK